MHFNEIKLSILLEESATKRSNRNLQKRSAESNKLHRPSEVISYVFRPLLDPAVGESQWELIRDISRGWVQSDMEPFHDIHDSKYTFQFFCESGIVALKEKYIEIVLQATKEIELTK